MTYREQPIPVDLVDGTTTFLQEDFGAQAQQEGEAHLARVWEYFHAVEEIDVDGPDGVAALEALGDDPSVGAFCGCQTCEVREVLFASAPILVAGARREFEREHQRNLGRVFHGAQPVQINLIACPEEKTP